MILLTVIFVVLVVLFYNRRTVYLTWKYPKVRTMTYFPIVGHLGMIKYINPSVKSFMEFWSLLTSDSGRLLQVLNIKMMMVYKVEDVEVILTHENTQNKHYVYDFLKLAIGDSIMRAKGQVWKDKTKAMRPTMHTKTVSTYTEDMCKCVEILADKWTNIDKTFDAMQDVAKCLLDMLFTTSFGVNLNCQANQTKFDEYSESFAELFMDRSMSAWKHPDFVYNLTFSSKKLKNVIHHISETTDQIFTERKEIYSLEQELAKDEICLDDKPIRNMKFIDYMLDLHTFNDQEIKDEVNTFTFAGFDTCKAGVSFTLIALALHQDMQEKVYQEILDVIGADRTLSYEDLSKLVYLDKFLKETMRLFPPVTIIARIADDEFPLGAHIVPKGTQVMCNILATHRSSLYWENPLKFDPERFSAEGLAKQRKFSYIPFLAGTRACFGTKVAMLSLKSAIVTLIRKYKFYTPYKSIEDVKLEVKVTLSAEKGILLRLEKR